MKRILLALALLPLAGTVLVLWPDAKSAPLPAPLAQVRCPGGAPASHDVIAMAGTRLLRWCTSAVQLDQWRLSLRKLPGGGFEPANIVSIPSIHDAQYVLEAAAWAKPFAERPDNGYERTLTIPTPPPFAPTGPETTFACQVITVTGGTNASGGGWQRVYSDHRCVGDLRSQHLHWRMTVRFGEPLPREYDVKPSLREAYELLAAHIRSEEPTYIRNTP